MNEHERKHAHPLTDAELHALAERRAERVREGQHKARHGHGADLFVTLRFPEGTLDLDDLWRAFWGQAEVEGSSDPLGTARDALIAYYGTHGFLEERYKREQERSSQ